MMMMMMMMMMMIVTTDHAGAGNEPGQGTADSERWPCDSATAGS